MRPVRVGVCADRSSSNDELEMQTKIEHTNWTLKEVSAALNGKIAKASIREIDGSPAVIGRTCIATPMANGTWDVWICNSEDLRAGLGQRAVTNRLRRLKHYALKGSVVVASGEAWLRVHSIQFLADDPDLCRLLGIRRKREISSELRESLVARLQRPGSSEPA